MSEETRQKRIEKNIKPMLGKNHSEESKLKMSESHKGKIMSKEHKNNISKVLKGNTYSKLSKILLDTQSGIFYDSINKALIASNINYSTLKGMLQNKFKNKTNLIFV